MADEKTGPDQLRLYLTGAGSDGGAQTDPDASLGNYRSSTEVQPLGWSISNAISGITIDFVAGQNGTGSGSLTASGVSELKWTPPGGTQGSGVTIANGETKIIQGGTDAEKYIRVTRTSASDLTGTATLTLTDVFNNLIGFDNVSAAEQAAGDTEYRCLAFKNEHASDQATGLKVWLALLGTAQKVDASGLGTGAGSCGCKDSFSDWPSSGYCYNSTTEEVAYYVSRTDSALTFLASGRDIWDDTYAGPGIGHSWAEDDDIQPIPGIRIAKEAPSSQPSGSFTNETANGEGTQPAGLTWVHPIASDDANVVNIGNLAAGYIYGLWLERKIIAAATAEATILNHLEFTFDTVS